MTGVGGAAYTYPHPDHSRPSCGEAWEPLFVFAGSSVAAHRGPVLFDWTACPLALFFASYSRGAVPASCWGMYAIAILSGHEGARG